MASSQFDECHHLQSLIQLPEPKRRRIDDDRQRIDLTRINEDNEAIVNSDSNCESSSYAGKSESTTPKSIDSSTTPTQTDSLSDDNGFPLDNRDDNNDDDVSSTVSNLSELTGISMLTDEGDESFDYRNASSWVQKQIQLGTDPRYILKLLSGDLTQIPPELDDITLWRHVIDIISEPQKRQKLEHINTITDVVELIKKSKNIIVLTGAGVSVSCGIPDFRSRDGIYSRLAQDFPDLPDPQAMFDINYFSQDPRPFYKFAREIYPGQFKPSPCHKFIKMLEGQNKLLRNYSQNIDTLERVAGIKNLIECHGSFATASCTKCKFQMSSDDVKEKILAQIIPMCPKCQDSSTIPFVTTSTDFDENYRDLVAQGVMKPDIVFFGEGLPDAFHDAMANDKDICDLLIVIGSSLKVRPVALIPSSIPHNIPQILINRESLPHLEFDVELLGDGDVVINQLCHMIGGNFKQVCWRDNVMNEATNLLESLNDSWDHSQDTSTSQDYSQDSLANNEKNNFSLESKNELRIFSRAADEPQDESSKFHANFIKNNESTISEDDETVKNNLDSCSDNFVGEKNDKVIEASSNSSGINSNSCSPSNYNTRRHENEFWNNDQDLKKRNNNKDLLDFGNNISNTRSENLSSSFRRQEYNDVVHETKSFEFRKKRDIKGQSSKLNFDDNSSIRQDVNSSSESNTSLIRDSMLLNLESSPTTSYESSRATEEMFLSDECQVVPRIDCLRDDATLEGNLHPCKSSDLKPRHSSIDSVMDSALGDSCSSSDCQKGKTDIQEDENKKFHKNDSNFWQPINRISLASRLPENSYYQMKSGKYIFPGAEVYTNFPWTEGVLQIGDLRSALTANQLSKH